MAPAPHGFCYCLDLGFPSLQNVEKQIKGTLKPPRLTLRSSEAELRIDSEVAVRVCFSDGLSKEGFILALGSREHSPSWRTRHGRGNGSIRSGRSRSHLGGPGSKENRKEAGTLFPVATHSW